MLLYLEVESAQRVATAPLTTIAEGLSCASLATTGSTNGWCLGRWLAGVRLVTSDV
jgi:hypothetical protein